MQFFELRKVVLTCISLSVLMVTIIFSIKASLVKKLVSLQSVN
jgi:hypothetical protein